MEDLDFSIIIPTFNRADNIKNLLNHFLICDYKKFEIIICDDGSTDNTREIVVRYQNLLDIKYIYTKNWGGPARPRNLGILKAKNDWILFLDSDDIWEKDKLTFCSNYILKNPSFDFYFHLMTSTKQSGNTFKQIGSFKPHQNPLKNFYKLIYNGNSIVLSSVIVRKQVLLDVHMFSEDKSLIAIEDYDLYLRLCLHGAKFKYIKRNLGKYIISEDSISVDSLKYIYKIEKMHNNYLNAGYKINKNKLYAILEYKRGVLMQNVKSPKKFKHLLNAIKYSFNLKLILKSIIRIVSTR